MVRNPTTSNYVKRIVDKLKSKADIEAKEKAFLSEIENAKAEALMEKEKCHLELTKKEQKQKHRNKVSEQLVRAFQGVNEY